MKIVFFGSSQLIVPIIESLKENFELALVITTEKNPADSVPSYCINNKIPYISASSLKDQNIKQLMLDIKAPVAVLADFGLIVPKEILDVFPKGIINVHPSLLPKFRGPTPAQSAILENAKTTGVSIIKLDEKVDHGPVLIEKEIPIDENDTSRGLYEKLFEIGKDLLPKTLNKYLKGSLIPKPQDHTKATFTKPLDRQNGYLDFDNPPTKEKLKLMIRAYFPWPGVWFKTILNSTEKI